MVLAAGISMCGSCHTDMLLQVTSINCSGLGVYSLAAATRSIMLSQEAVSVSVSERELELEPASELKVGRPTWRGLLPLSGSARRLQRTGPGTVNVFRQWAAAGPAPGRPCCGLGHHHGLCRHHDRPRSSGDSRASVPYPASEAATSASPALSSIGGRFQFRVLMAFREGHGSRPGEEARIRIRRTHGNIQPTGSSALRTSTHSLRDEPQANPRFPDFDTANWDPVSRFPPNRETGEFPIPDSGQIGKGGFPPRSRQNRESGPPGRGESEWGISGSRKTSIPSMLLPRAFGFSLAGSLSGLLPPGPGLCQWGFTISLFTAKFKFSGPRAPSANAGEQPKSVQPG